MPWTTPTLRTVRETVRGEITTSLGRASFTGNSVLRVIADATAALCHLTLRYIDWLALQFLPDTAEHEWLDRHGDIWLVNSDGTVGRKGATLSSGSATMTGTIGIPVPTGTQLTDGTTTFETTEDIFIGSEATPVAIRAIGPPGSSSNLESGTTLSFISGIAGVDGSVIVVELLGGTDAETDDELRARVLRRIQQPPMGGAAYDYEAWALAVPGVTRAWTDSEMGIGTVTTRFMMDDLRADVGGFPLDSDIAMVDAYIDTKKPVSVKDSFVLSPIPYPIDFNIVGLNPDTPSVQAAIEENIQQMLFLYASPGQTIFSAWKYSAVMAAAGVISFNMTDNLDDVMPSPGHMAVLGDIYYTVAMVE
jgi:uncharacterized phage protein gp47/JayE